MTALTDPENVLFEVVGNQISEDGMSLVEAYAFLTGADRQTSEVPKITVAAADVSTGAMIALVPTEEDATRLALEDFEAPEQLHLTLVYLGEAADFSPEARESIISTVKRYAADPITARAFAVNIFNPDNDEGAALVLGVGNDGGPALEELRSNVFSAVNGLGGMKIAENHTPWIPHVTLAYSEHAHELVTKASARVGPVTFDRVRVAFGGETTDVPLSATVSTRSADIESRKYDMDAALDREEQKLALNFAKERDVNAPGGGHDLRNYWVKGPGAVKIRWGTDGSFARCVANLGKHVKNPQGLCAEYHKAATGEWPAEKGVESSVDDVLTAAKKKKTDDDDEKKLTPHTYDVDEPWEGTLVVEGVESGDSRLFGLGSLDWAQLPMPLQYQPASIGGHNGSVTIGEISHAARRGNEIYGWGTIFANALNGEHADGIQNAMRVGGVSVDVDSVKDASVEMVFGEGEDGANPFAKPEMTIFHQGRIRGATLVAFPAFVEAKLKFTGDIVVAHGSHDQGDHGNRYGSQPRPDWSYGDKFEDLTSVLSLPDRVSAVRIRKGDDILGYAVRHPTRGERYVRSDRMGSTPDGMNDIFEAAKMLMADPPQTASACDCDDATVLTASVNDGSSHTITIPNLPKAEWFNEPTDVESYGALTITDEGRVFGIVAPPNTTHRSVNKKVPRNVDFSRFHKGETIVQGGGRVVTGVITAACGHAPTENYGTLEKRREHYDNSCSVLANVRVGYARDGGIWCAGALNPGARAEQVAQALGCALSLDVQPHPDKPGIADFLSAHLVPVPGFPMARTNASVMYNDGTLVAAAVPVLFTDEPQVAAFDVFNLVKSTKLALAQSLGLDPQTRKRELAADLAEFHGSHDQRDHDPTKGKGGIGGFIRKIGGGDGLSKTEKKKLSEYDYKLFNDVDLTPAEHEEYRALQRKQKMTTS